MRRKQKQEGTVEDIQSDDKSIIGFKLIKAEGQQKTFENFKNANYPSLSLTNQKRGWTAPEGTFIPYGVF